MISLKRLAVLSLIGIVTLPVAARHAKADDAAAAGTPHALTDEEEAEIAAKDKVWLGIGARVRFLTIPQSVFELLFVSHATNLTAVGYGAQFIRRKGNLDIELGVEFEQLVPKDGLWNDKGNDPSQVGEYPDFQHSSVSAIGITGTFLWHTDITSRVALRYGVGFGALIGFGDIQRTKTTCDATTTNSDLDDPNRCTPIPSTTFNQSYPPVLPLINLVGGLRVKIADQFSMDVEIGVEDIILFSGVGFGYFF